MKGGYDPSYFADLVAVEDRHFWFRGRNQLISALASQVLAKQPAGYRVLEVGCGNGNVLRYLESACDSGFVVGMDYFAEGLRFARGRSTCALVQGDLARPPFSAGFHLVGMFDVLEHLPDDVRVLQHVWQMLAPGGTLLLTVPGHQSLWSQFDEASGHWRRYEHKDLEEKLKAAGFAVEHLTQYMASIYPLVWLSRALSRRGGGSVDAADAVRRELRIVPFLNEALAFILVQESKWVARRHSLPIGTSLVAIARKAA